MVSLWWLLAGVPVSIAAFTFLALRRRLRSSKERPIFRTEDQLDREQGRLEAHREGRKEEITNGRAADHADVDSHWMRGGDG